MFVWKWHPLLKNIWNRQVEGLFLWSNLPSQGKNSSDEEDLDDIPDDDQYDTEDSFIDDAELVGTCIFIDFRYLGPFVLLSPLSCLFTSEL